MKKIKFPFWSRRSSKKAVKKNAALRLKQQLESMESLEVEERNLNTSPVIKLYAIRQFDHSDDCDYVTEKTIGYFTSVAHGLDQDQDETKEGNSSCDLKTVLGALFKEEANINTNLNIVIPCSQLWAGEKRGFFLMINRKQKTAISIGLPKQNKRSLFLFGFLTRKNRAEPQRQLHELLNSCGIKKCLFKKRGNFKFLIQQWKKENKKTEKRNSTFSVIN